MVDLLLPIVKMVDFSMAIGKWWFNGGLMGFFMGYMMVTRDIPSGKLSHSYGKIHHFSWEQSTTNMVTFHSYVTLPEGTDVIITIGE